MPELARSMFKKRTEKELEVNLLKPSGKLCVL